MEKPTLTNSLHCPFSSSFDKKIHICGFAKQQLDNPDDLSVGEAAMGIMADAVSK